MLNFTSSHFVLVFNPGNSGKKDHFMQRFFGEVVTDGVSRSGSAVSFALAVMYLYLSIVWKVWRVGSWAGSGPGTGPLSIESRRNMQVMLLLAWNLKPQTSVMRESRRAGLGADVRALEAAVRVDKIDRVQLVTGYLSYMW